MPRSTTTLVLLAACSTHAVTETSPAPQAPPAAPAPPKLPVSLEPMPEQPVLAATCPAARPSGLRAPFDGSPFGSKRTTTGAKTCDVADNNLARAEDAILALPMPPAGGRATAWDRKRAPARLDRLVQRFGLGAADNQKLAANGFVVTAAQQESYAWAYHEIYQSQLPIFVTVDSILHAVYATHDHLVADLERRELQPRLVALLAGLHCALPTTVGRYPRDTAHDLDVYLIVARTLVLGKAPASQLGDAAAEREAAALVAKVQAAGSPEAVELFGRTRLLDFGAYQPRGHYGKELAPFFRAAMWLSRIEFNLVSRSSRSSAPGDAPDPRETPREDIDALALADLVATSGRRDDLATFEQTWSMLAGRREDISIDQLAALRARAEIADLNAADADAKLRAAIGNGFQRTARIHPMPPRSTVLPAIATLLGPRIVADTVAVRPLANTETPDRNHILAGDIAFLLGHDRGKQYLATDLARFPTLATQLDKARELLAAAPRQDDLYTAWLDAIRALAVRPAGATPAFMATPAFADMRINSTLAAYAQIRHDHVLIAGQPYGEGGCEIPDGYLEPAPDVYDALARYADVGAAAMTKLTDVADARAYFQRLGKLARIFAKLSRMELANAPLPPAAQEFLGMVAEIEPFGSDGRPTYTGWYFDLFADRDDAIGHPELVADYFTGGIGTDGGVDYLGVGLPRMGVFVVDTGGGPRAMVGPVAQAYEHHGPHSPRLDDETAATLPADQRPAPWSASYAVAVPPEPSFAAALSVDWDKKQDVVEIRTKAPLGTLAIELLDHHRVAYARKVVRVGTGKTEVRFAEPDPEKRYPRLIHFQVGGFNAWGEQQCGDGCRPFAYGAMAKETLPADDQP